MAFEMSLALSRGDYLAVPDVAVQWGADGAYLWTAKSVAGQLAAQRAERIEIQIIKRLDGLLLIEADLSAGALIITEGVPSVREGLALKLLDPTTLDGEGPLKPAQSSTSTDVTPND